MKSLVEPCCKHCIVETDCLGCDVYHEAMQAEQDFLLRHTVENLVEAIDA